MSFRVRLFLAFIFAVLLPIIALALIIRGEMTGRFTAQYNARVASLIEGIGEDLSQESGRIDAALAVIKRSTLQDNRFRRAAVDRASEERAYLLDYAGVAMRLTGLTMLQIQDESGRIVSSGHFRNEYDRMERELPSLLEGFAGRMVLAEMRAPEAPFLALARIDSLRMGERQFAIVAGTRVERGMLERLARGNGLSVSLVYPGGVMERQRADAAAADEGAGPARGRGFGAGAIEEGSEGAVAGELDIPFIGLERGVPGQAAFRVTRDLADLRELRRSIDRWFAAATVAAVLLVLFLVAWLTSRISRPIADLAAKTGQVDLDRLDVDFSTRRTDEIGVLSRGLETMTERLRASAVLVREAERRAAIGDLARQVNHDIKNGLTPIRNIVRHLLGLAREAPGDLQKVFEERRESLDGGIAYLEQLASNYARLSPARNRRLCDVNEIVRRVVREQPEPDGVRVHLHLAEGIFVMGDEVSLRRIFENLYSNAIESFDSRAGTVSIVTEAAPREDRVRITVTDTGTGMNEEQRSRIFNDFYTTKERGTGLGLSIVRRLVMDLGGSIRVESEAGTGSRFSVELPAARPAGGEAGATNEEGY